VNNLFRGLILSRNSNLWQCFFAEKQYKIENNQEFVNLEKKIAAVKIEKDSESAFR
jgi:hypothetical protein